ncbi:MAG: hypothetical protein WD139_13345, partial [Balneolaceae bacterium]
KLIATEAQIFTEKTILCFQCFCGKNKIVCRHHIYEPLKAILKYLCTVKEKLPESRQGCEPLLQTRQERCNFLV